MPGISGVPVLLEALTYQESTAKKQSVVKDTLCSQLAHNKAHTPDHDLGEALGVDSIATESLF